MTPSIFVMISAEMIKIKQRQRAKQKVQLT